MSSKTIAKFSLFVIWLLASAAIFPACISHSQNLTRKNASDLFQPPKIVGRLASPDLTEASGIASSKCQPDVFWTLNDSGDDAFIYAFNSAGANLGTWRVTGAKNSDWEDIAEFKDARGQCFVYIADIGDNGGKRDFRTIYRVAEPVISSESRDKTRTSALVTAPAEALGYTTDAMKMDSETLLVHPATGDLYVLTKSRKDPSIVFKISPAFGSTDVQKAVRIAEIKVPSVPFGLLTGGDISPDGRRVVLCDYLDGYELTLSSGDNNFDDIWKQQPVEIDLGDRDTGEAVGYGSDGNTIYATTEGRNAPVIELKRKE
jgi:hypothetical protein